MMDGQWPSICIVTPSYNQGRFLEQTITSVLNQGYPNLEYVVMDAGSTDNSVEIIKKHADRLSHWISEKDHGQADALSRGFQLATGEIMGYVNSDDLLLPGCLTYVGEYFSSHPQMDCFLGGAIWVDDQNQLYLGRSGLPVVRWPMRVNRQRLLLAGMGFDQPAAFWRRELFEAVGGFDPDLQFCFDYDLFLRLSRRGRFGRSRRFLAAFRIHPRSKTSMLQEIRLREYAELQRRYGIECYRGLGYALAGRYWRTWEMVRNLTVRAGSAVGIIPVPKVA